MNTRKKDRLGYKILQETGRNVVIPGRENLVIKMVEQEVLEELEIVEGISHSLNVYALDELSTKDELSEALGIMSGLSQNYRHFHVELKSKLDDTNNERYSKYNVIVNKLIAFIKSAKNMENYKEGAG